MSITGWCCTCSKLEAGGWRSEVGKNKVINKTLCLVFASHNYPENAYAYFHPSDGEARASWVFDSKADLSRKGAKTVWRWINFAPVIEAVSEHKMNS